MVLMPRDLRLLQFIGEYGTADRSLLQSVFFPDDATGRATQRRLAMLVMERLLVRTRIVLADGFLKAEGVPALYFLTDAGTAIVEAETGQRPRRVMHSRPSPFTLRHRLLAVRVRLVFDQAARLLRLPPLEWIMEQDTRPTATKSFQRHASENFILWDVFSDAQPPSTFRPDASCHLQIPRPSGQGFKSLLAYLEFDRSTESHAQWTTRLRGMTDFFAVGDAWKRHWPTVQTPSVILFVVCPTQRRIRGLAQASAHVGLTNYLRFTTYPVDPRHVLTSPIWHDVDGHTYSILKPQ